MTDDTPRAAALPRPAHPVPRPGTHYGEGVARVDDVGATLLKAAEDVLATEGPSALTVRHIANRAGVSTMNVYSRFGGKDGVVEHLFVEGFLRLASAMEAVPTTDDPLDDLRRCGLAYRRFALENPTYYSIMFERVVADYEPTAEGLLCAGNTLSLLAARLSRAMEMGAMAPADPWHAAAAVWATCHGVMSLEMKAAGPKELDWEQVFRSATEAMLTGLVQGSGR
jgi:AcrR family transcriptional regulator